MNYLASQPAFIFRRDLTATHAHSLAPETLAQLREIAPRVGRKTDPLPKIEIYVTLPRTVEGDSDEAKNQRRNFATINAQLDALLDAFSYESNRIAGDAVKVERVDLTLNANLYNELSEKLKGTFQPGGRRSSCAAATGSRPSTSPTFTVSAKTGRVRPKSASGAKRRFSRRSSRSPTRRNRSSTTRKITANSFRIPPTRCAPIHALSAS